MLARGSMLPEVLKKYRFFLLLDEYKVLPSGTVPVLSCRNFRKNAQNQSF